VREERAVTIVSDTAAGAVCEFSCVARALNDSSERAVAGVLDVFDR
jgi:hypothetical protein